MSDDSRISAYLFAVEIDGIETARFQKCEGLEAETEVFEYEEGGGGVLHFKGRSHYPNIVLERGINENDVLFKWYKQCTEGKIERKTGSVVLYDLAENEIRRWDFYNALPCRWIGPRLDAHDPRTFAVERIEIAHEGFFAEPEQSVQPVKNKKDDDVLSNEQIDVRNCPIEGHDGHWTGLRGVSTWIPDDDFIPEKLNPNKLTWKDLKEKYKFAGIPFRKGEPDFSKIEKGNVQIEGYGVSRPKNFAKADVELAKKRRCSPSEVRIWRENHSYTWHESRDCKTMSKIPNEVHLNVSHRGGISNKRNGV